MIGMERINEEYEDLGSDIPIYRASLFRLNPFILILGLYRRIFKGNWFIAYRVDEDISARGEHIKILKGQSRELERDILIHELNHGDVDIEDVVPESYLTKYVMATLGWIVLGVGVVGSGYIAPESKLSLSFVFLAGMTYFYGIHTVIEKMEEEVNSDINWDKHKDELTRDLPERVNKGISKVDGIIHTSAGLMAGLYNIAIYLPLNFVEIIILRRE